MIKVRLSLPTLDRYGFRRTASYQKTGAIAGLLKNSLLTRHFGILFLFLCGHDSPITRNWALCQRFAIGLVRYNAGPLMRSRGRGPRAQRPQSFGGLSREVARQTFAT
jgi:hypothetical protein